MSKKDGGNIVRAKHTKGSKELLFIMTQTHNLHIFGVVPFVKLQNNTEQLNDEKGDEKGNNLSFFGCCCVVHCLENPFFADCVSVS